MNTFIINEVPIQIRSITPKTVISNYNGLTDYVEAIVVNYNSTFTDIASSQVPDLSSVNFSVSLTINTENHSLSGYINYEDLKKEDFFPIAVSTAYASPEIQDMVKRIRLRNGLDAHVPRPNTSKPRLRPFQ